MAYYSFHMLPDTFCCCSVAQSGLTLCNPLDCGRPGFPVLHYLLKLMSLELMMPTNHLILCLPLLLLPSIFLSINIFSNESALCIRWSMYLNFSFSISPFNEYSGLISFRVDWFDLLAVQGTLQSSPIPQFKNIDSSVLSLLYDPTLTSLWSNSHIHT